MLGYYAAYLIVILCILLSFGRNRKLDNMSFVVLGIVLVCLCGFRHVDANFWGNDSYPYYYNFIHSNSRNPVFYGTEYYDLAFIYLTKFIRFFTENEYIYGFIIALLTISPILFLYKKVSPMPFVAVFLYVCFQVGGSSPYFMAFNQMRQALAAGILCIAVYHYNGNNYRFNRIVVAWLIVMALTHWSSLLMIIPFLLKEVRLNKYFYIAGMIVAAIAGLFAAQFVPQLSDLFTLMEQNFFVDDDKEFSLISNIPLLLLSCYVFFISSDEECNSFEHKCLFLQFVLLGFLAPFNNSIFRFCIYFGVIGNLAIASSFYKSFKKKNAISVGVALVAFLYISRVLLISLSGLQKEYPYSMW